MWRNTTNYLLDTDTFRARSRALFETQSFPGYGTNLQNIPDRLRRIYQADEGKLLAQTDQSGAEALIVAYLCRHGKFRDLFLNGIKPHVFVALHIFLDRWKIKCKDVDIDKFANTPIADLKNLQGWKELDLTIKDSDSWSSNERYYFIGKKVVHASNYGMHANTFQMAVLVESMGEVVLSRKDAELYLAQFHALFPEIHEWHWSIDKELESDIKRLYNLQGFPREFTRIIREGDKKETYAFKPQSTVGVITHIAITNTQKFIEQNKLDWDILGNCHDSFLVQAPESEIHDCVRQMKLYMEQDLVSPRGEKFTMRSSGAIGKNWGKYKKDNLEGMREI